MLTFLHLLRSRPWGPGGSRRPICAGTLALVWRPSPEIQGLISFSFKGSLWRCSGAMRFLWRAPSLIRTCSNVPEGHWLLSLILITIIIIPIITKMTLFLILFGSFTLVFLG